MKRISILVMLLFLSSCCAGCGENDAAKHRQKRRDRAWAACIDKGGVPIEGSYGKLDDCRFKPETTK